MKKFTIDAFSLEDAKAQAAEMGLTVVRNVTPSWKKIGSPATSSKAFHDFAESVMKVNRLADAEGVGLMQLLATYKAFNPEEFTIDLHARANVAGKIGKDIDYKDVPLTKFMKK